MNEKIKKGRENKVNNSIERYKEVLDAFITIVNYYFINNPHATVKVFELPDYSNEFWEALEKVCKEEKFYVETTFSRKKVKIYLNYPHSPIDF